LAFLAAFGSFLAAGAGGATTAAGALALPDRLFPVSSGYYSALGSSRSTFSSG